jgi:hypothetical protein
MAFELFKHGILVYNPDPTADAGLTLNNNLRAIGDLFDNVLRQSGTLTSGHLVSTDGTNITDAGVALSTLATVASQTSALALKLSAANNLSDIASAATSRTNLGLGSTLSDVSTLQTGLTTTNANVATNTSAITTNSSSIAANTTAIALKANIASPTFTGTVVAPIVSGNSSTGLTLNGNSSTGIILSGDNAAITVSGVITSSHSITATSFIGPLTGNVTGNVSGSAGSLSANIAESQVTNLVSDLAAKASQTSLNTTNSNVASNTSAIALKANIASPTFTGTITGNGSGLTSLSAANLSGVIPPVNLGSGTPSSSNYLRGDGTWQTLAGGGSQWTDITGGISYSNQVTIGSTGGTPNPGYALYMNDGSGAWLYNLKTFAVSSYYGISDPGQVTFGMNNYGVKLGRSGGAFGWTPGYLPNPFDTQIQSPSAGLMIMTGTGTATDIGYGSRLQVQGGSMSVQGAIYVLDGSGAPQASVGADGNISANGSYYQGGSAGFTGTGAYTTFTIQGGIITAAS